MWTLRRRAARVVLLDPADRVLLLQAVDPVNPAKGRWWELPGGGIDGDEPSALAAARELYEETGIREVEMGPCVWQHHARFTFGGFRFDQHELIHVARGGDGSGDYGEYRPAGLEALEAAAFLGARWWALDQLTELVAAGGRIIPPWLLEQLKSGSGLDWAGGPGLPAEPIDMGELGDLLS